METKVEWRGERMLGELEQSIAANPAESVLGGVGIGYLLAFLPLVAIAGQLVRLGFALLRPALMVYAVVKLAEACRASRVGPGAVTPPPEK